MAQREGFKTLLLWHLNFQNWCLKCQKRRLSFLEWTPDLTATLTYFVVKNKLFSNLAHC